MERIAGSVVYFVEIVTQIDIMRNRVSPRQPAQIHPRVGMECTIIRGRSPGKRPGFGLHNRLNLSLHHRPAINADIVHRPGEHSGKPPLIVKAAQSDAESIAGIENAAIGRGGDFHAIDVQRNGVRPLDHRHVVPGAVVVGFGRIDIRASAGPQGIAMQITQRSRALQFEKNAMQNPASIGGEDVPLSRTPVNAKP